MILTKAFTIFCNPRISIGPQTATPFLLKLPSTLSYTLTPDPNPKSFRPVSPL